MKTYKVSDLFYTTWKELTPKVQARVYMLQQEATQQDIGSIQYGCTVIQVLRHLRKNATLVNKLTVEQAVDIYNDLKFLTEPWYHFPALKNFITPEEKMARHTFDQFIYADNEFTMYLATHDLKYLRRLIVTLYQKPGDNFFDKECVEQRERKLKAKDYELALVFYTYAQVREFVTGRCKVLLPKGKGNDDEQTITPTGSLWLQLKHRLAETPAFQGYDNAGRSNMYSSLDYLEDLAQLKQDANP